MAGIREILSTSFVIFLFVTQGYCGDCPPDCWDGGDLYPNLQDCSKFYQCAHGTPYLMSCPAGLHYSLSLERCDYPEEANCTADPSYDCGETTPTTRAPDSQTSSDPAASEAPVIPLDDQLLDSGDCIPPCPSPEALYPHPHDCTKYFHCANSVPYLKSCPHGQEYWGDMERCDWPEYAQCVASPEAPCDAITAPPRPTVSSCKPSCPWPYAYMPHPQDCTKFYVCDGQSNAFESSCQAGLFYSMDTLRCDYPEVALCTAGPQHGCDELLTP
ncbi:Cuticle Protein CPAP3 [Hyalella azteca]|nr:Cuticle Protein CPAP3 [Hyalella azteca]